MSLVCKIKGGYSFTYYKVLKIKKQGKFYKEDYVLNENEDT
jgi:hypothetical protein